MAESSQDSLKAQHLWDVFSASKDEHTRDELIEHYMPLAQVIAAKVFRRRFDEGSSFDDYLQYARVGLIQAVDRFDTGRSVSFESYSSHRIRGAILNGVQQESELAAQRSFWRKRIQERADSFLDELGVRAKQASLQDLIEVTVGFALAAVLDDTQNEPADDQPQSNPYAATEMEQLTQRVRELVLQLPERERAIVQGHYFELREFQAIANDYGLTKGRVSQLHARSLRKLRELLDAKPGVDTKV